jgi:hypothetical protein
MKRLINHYMWAAGFTDRAEAIKKKTGVSPILLDAITFRNIAIWHAHTIFWISILESDYFQKRIEKIRLDVPTYMPNPVDFIPLFHASAPTTIEFIKMLDDCCKTATGCLFQDSLFPTASPPEGGPYFDLCDAVVDEKMTIPIGLIHPIILSLGLRFSKKTKDISDLKTITRRDIKFLANFIITLSQDKPLIDKLIPLLSQEDITILLFMAITPKEPLSLLEFNETIVLEGLQRLHQTIELYESNPEQVIKNIQDL